MTKNKNSVQGLIGFERFSRFGVKTDKAEIAFFSVEPTNISVLSAANIDVKIHHLMMLLSTIPDLEILALDSCECFDTNKVYVKKRLQTEQNEDVRKLLQADYDFLDEIQVEMSSAWFCQYHLTHFIRTRIMQRERYDHSRAFFELPEAAHRWRCRFFC